MDQVRGVGMVLWEAVFHLDNPISLPRTYPRLPHAIQRYHSGLPHCIALHCITLQNNTLLHGYRLQSITTLVYHTITDYPRLPLTSYLNTLDYFSTTLKHSGTSLQRATEPEHPAETQITREGIYYKGVLED